MNKTIKELLEFSIINIDKPSGPTSFQVDDFIKKTLGLKKTAHFGTLDPKVTGVLPVALSRACKLSNFFMYKDKTYVGTMHLHKDIKLKILQEIIDKEFTGKIKQLPPKRSKVKRAEREREIKKFELLEKNGKDVLFFAEVQAGTYIRKLISDLGDKIGGAHMTELRRVKAGIFSEEQSINLYDFQKAVEENKIQDILIPAEKAIKEVLPIIQINNEQVIAELLKGKPIHKEDLKEKLPKEEIFAVFLKNKFIEIAKKVEEGEIIARPLFVLN